MKWQQKLFWIGVAWFLLAEFAYQNAGPNLFLAAITSLIIVLVVAGVMQGLVWLLWYSPQKPAKRHKPAPVK